MEENDNDATSFAVGTLSLGYLAALSRSYAGADYAVTSCLRWTFNSEPRLCQSLDTTRRNADAPSGAESQRQVGVAEDCGGTKREAST